MAAIDGLEWNVLLPLVKVGRVPTIAKLLERGSFGLLATSQPTWSPVLWTTVATGKSPEQHGIRGFVVRQGKAITRLYNSRDRKAKALWNIVSDAHKSVAVVGWWMTYPVEAVNGLMVAQVNTLDQAAGKQGRAVAKGRLVKGLEDQVYPRELSPHVLAIHERVQRGLKGRLTSIVGTFHGRPSLLERRLLANTIWSFRADATYLEVLEDLLDAERARYDLVAIYIGGTDVVGHRYWRYKEPDRFSHPPPQESVSNFGHMIRDYYTYVDRSLGKILARLPEDATVLILSDHGMHAINTEQRFDGEPLPEDVNSGGHQDGPPGVFIAAGHGIRRMENTDSAGLERENLRLIGSLYDIAPTVLALLDVPVGMDMEGHILVDVLDGIDPARVRTVPTHDTLEWRQERSELSPEDASQRADEARIEQLRSLGYIR